MKKHKIKASVVLICSAVMFLTSCAKENTALNITEESGSNGSADQQFTFVDGSSPGQGEITGYTSAPDSSGGGTYGFETNVCFYVPIGASAAQRTEGEAGAWVKLTEGSAVGDLTVTEAKSSYIYDRSYEKKYGERHLAAFQQTVSLKGGISLTAAAGKDTAMNGELTGDIICTLDDESSEKLFSLSQSYKFFDLESGYENHKNFTGEKFSFYLTDSIDGFREVYEKLQEDQNTQIKFEADEITLSYVCDTVLDGGGRHKGTIKSGSVDVI